MNVQNMNLSQDAALAALREYKAHRNAYDARDWEIERIYRAISKGKTIISVNDAIVRAGLDATGLPRLAIMRADQERCICDAWPSDAVHFRTERRSRGGDLYFKIPWPSRATRPLRDGAALLPRIPPQFRPSAKDLPKYHLLWEADWASIPRDPYLLKRIGKDAWVVLAAWDLTDVEVSVVRAHRAPQ